MDYVVIVYVLVITIGPDSQALDVYYDRLECQRQVERRSLSRPNCRPLVIDTAKVPDWLKSGSTPPVR
jgi:hypothetical protein